MNPASRPRPRRNRVSSRWGSRPSVAERWRISREAQDTVAARSHARAAAAQKSGRFDSQIVPVHTKWKDPKTGVVSDVVISRDDGVREGVTTEALASFPRCSRRAAPPPPGTPRRCPTAPGAWFWREDRTPRRRDFRSCGRFVSFAAVGVDPKVMGIGPAVAIPEALRKAGVGVQTWTSSNSTRRSRRRRRIAPRNSDSIPNESTSTEAPSRWDTRSAPPAPGASRRSCTR